ncbi:MAG: glutamate--tRNA ligase [Bdellovibrionota bacterium]
MSVVVRFAPSPTGMLHVGGARTAIFNYFFARSQGGRFILRIEDTDTERSKQEYTDEILDSMKWLGLDWDAEPIYQTQRFDIYRDYVRKMLADGTAYKCWATAEEIDSMRAKATAEGKKPMYDRRYRDYTGAEPSGPYVVRFKTPLTGTTVVHDLIKGDVTFSNEEIDDFVILRSNDAPTYNFTVVVDDVEMKITHVIRGDDHLNNTPKQILLMQAMGFKIPNYGHVPMILGADKMKLSKRHGAVAVTNYREEGYLPESMLNALVRLGWSKGDQEIFSKSELCKDFPLAGCGSSPSVFDRAKLDHLNNHYIREKSLEDLCALLKKTYLVDLSPLLASESSRKLFEALRERAVRMTDFSALAEWYLRNDFARDEASTKEVMATAPREALEALATKWSAVPDSEFSGVKAFEMIKETATTLKLKIPQLAKPVRVLLTGTLASPDLGIVLEALGKTRALERLRKV